jgi:molecular chaperone GrpE
LEALRQEAAQNLDSAQRAQAELVNFRKRADEERIDNNKYSNSRLISKLLPVVEEMDLAMGHAGDSGAAPTWLDGVKLIQRKMISLLESEGVAAIESVGVPFNPLEHEALGTEESTEYPPGYIISALRTGYRLHDRIIQPAQVVVAREPQNGGTTAGKAEGSAKGSREKETGNE